MDFDDPISDTAMHVGDTSGNSPPPPPPPPPRPNPNPPKSRPSPIPTPTTKYKECLKNHAVGIGGHAVDGCGEFMPAGEDGTLDALKCAACNCHRNFHRKDPDSSGVLLFSPSYYRSGPPAGYYHRPPPPLALPSTSGGGGGSRDEMEEFSNPVFGFGSGSGKKRFRTKFTQEQKDRMLGFAESVGWRIQKHDEAAVQEFCAEIGVKRRVLKVWMHNNKHTLGKKP